MGGLVVWTLAAWALRLTDVINGYVFALLMVIAALLVPMIATRRLPKSDPVAGQQDPAVGAAEEPDADVPVEWWGIARDWAPEDKEALDRAIAARS